MNSSLIDRMRTEKCRYVSVDLFSGPGGLCTGFKWAGILPLIAVEWTDTTVQTYSVTHDAEVFELSKYIVDGKFNNDYLNEFTKESTKTLMIHGDINQVSSELIKAFLLSRYGIDSDNETVDVVSGGAPCESFSIAGTRTANDERDDLFSNILRISRVLKTKMILFENVKGLLSKGKDGKKGAIFEYICNSFEDENASITYKLVSRKPEEILLKASDYGVPQHRERLIILGIRKDVCDNPQELLHEFYTTILPGYKVSRKVTVEDAIGDLPPIYPIINEKSTPRRIGYTKPECSTSWHRARHHSLRDVEIYGMLADDILSGRNEYADSQSLSELYEERVGAKSPIHRYHVLRRDEPSTTIISHLDRDGNRFIHYDPKQSRDITPREAARIQSFDDEYDFIGNQTDTYIMIGNAVPPVLAKCVGLAVAEILDKLVGD